MFFGLTNSPSTFQTMMDTIFRDLVSAGEVIIYMDDILIATPDNLTHHRQLIHQVLTKLEKHNLHLRGTGSRIFGTNNWLRESPDGPSQSRRSE